MILQNKFFELLLLKSKIMTGELLLNGKDAYNVFGITMGDGFIDSLLTSAPQKEYIKNQCRSNNGTSIINNNPRIDERTLSLAFSIEGLNRADYLAKLKLFYAEISNGLVTVKVPPLGNDVYKLYYQKPVANNGNVNKTASKTVLQFIEPNPSDRS